MNRIVECALQSSDPLRSHISHLSLVEQRGVAIPRERGECSYPFVSRAAVAIGGKLEVQRRVAAEDDAEALIVVHVARNFRVRQLAFGQARNEGLKPHPTCHGNRELGY